MRLAYRILNETAYQTFSDASSLLLLIMAHAVDQQYSCVNKDVHGAFCCTICSTVIHSLIHVTWWASILNNLDANSGSWSTLLVLRFDVFLFSSPAPLVLNFMTWTPERWLLGLLADDTLPRHHQWYSSYVQKKRKNFELFCTKLLDIYYWTLYVLLI